MFYLLVFALSFVIALALTPLAGALGRKLGLLDRPGGRRRHQGAIPRTGGLALYVAFTATVLLTLLLGGTFCVVAGFLDDRYELGPLPQYAIQFVASLVAMAGLIFIKHVNNPFGPGFLFGPDGFPWWILAPLTIFWFMGMMNTVNWLDGLSGLVAGITAIMSGVLAVHMLFRADPPQLSVAILPVALLGASLGFLPFNFAPARIFMGSSGSYFLGFSLAALGIIGGARMATVLLVLGLPILDVAWLIVNRWRRGISPGQGGRDHLHFRLLDLGLSERTIVVSYWAFSALFGGLTLVINQRLYKLVALLGLGIVALAVLIWASQPRAGDPRASLPSHPNPPKSRER